MFNKVNSRYDWNSLRRYVQSSLKKENTGHDYSHIKRVIKNALLIIKEPNINYNVLLAAILLHDISYKNKPSKTHNIESAEIAKKILPKYGFEKNIINKIYHAIINHCRGSKPHDPVEKLSYEAKVLYDADVLDALGAVGIIRMISFSINQKIPYFKSRSDIIDESFFGNIKYLEKMKNNLILDNSKTIAEKRMEIVRDFIKQMDLEFSN
ncbi:HD domain-containing protein [Candidatus Pacearchaeota archaeon]|nr:HD domain-containing protein [Candidatus Pacearchaeota archaeon]